MNGCHGIFLHEFVKNPLRTASVAPSSPRMARDMAAPISSEGEPVVVEFGPGTGAFTAEIQRRLAGRGHHLAIEINARFAAVLRRRFPAVDVVVGDAAQLTHLLTDRNLPRADVIVSGLPWALFPGGVQRDLIDAVRAGLAEGGTFTTFAYVHAAWSPKALKFRRLLGETFDEVVTRPPVWRNLPPAFAYVARHSHR